MQNFTSLKHELEAQEKPRKDTIQFILNYSKALEVKKLKNGMEIDLIRN